MYLPFRHEIVVLSPGPVKSAGGYRLQSARSLSNTCRLFLGCSSFCILRLPSTIDRMRDQLEHSFHRQVDTSSANSAGHVMCYRHFSMLLASANLMVIM